MNKFEVNILGCGSATPTMRHMPSSQVVNFRDKLFMIDCGEGTQLQFRRMSLKFSRLNHIFISHLHGDHFLGLPGLLSTMALHEKEGCVTIHTFAEGVDLMRTIMKVVCRQTPFEIKYNVIDPAGGEIILDDKSLTVETFPLYHRVPCVGFLFREKPGERHLRRDMIDFYNVPVSRLKDIKAGADFVTADGRVIANDRLTTPADPAASYAYCSDTAFNMRVADAVRGVTTLYHEATYGDDADYKAKARGHSTSRQAAMIAREAGAGKLILGHYSKSYDTEEGLLAQAREEFPNTIAANECMVIPVNDTSL